MIRYIVLIFFSVLLRQGTFAQERPDWTNGYFEDVRNSYIECVSAEGFEPADARKKAMQQIVERRSLASGTDATVSMQGNDVKVEGNHNLIAKARVIDEYVERIEPGRYRVYLLVQTAKNPTLEYEKVKVTERYSFSPRVFVPGMAQLYKGSTTKGALFIAGEVAAIGGIVAFESLRSSKESKINSTHNASLRQKYIDDADRMQNLRNGFIAGAVAIYAWNMIDGIVAKGKKHVAIGQARLHITPYALKEAAGVKLCLNF